MVFVDLRQRVEIIHEHLRGPRAARKVGKVEFRVERDVSIGIVLAIVARKAGGDIATSQRNAVEPSGAGGANARTDHDGERAGAGRNRDCGPKRRLSVRAEFKAQVARDLSVGSAFVENDNVVERGLRRESADIVLLLQRKEFGSAGLPICGRLHHMAIQESQRVGESIDLRQRVEIRRQLARALQPCGERGNGRQSLNKLVEIGPALLGSHRQGKPGDREQCEKGHEPRSSFHGLLLTSAD